METNCFHTCMAVSKWEQRFQAHCSQMKDKFVAFRKIKQNWKVMKLVNSSNWNWQSYLLTKSHYNKHWNLGYKSFVTANFVFMLLTFLKLGERQLSVVSYFFYIANGMAIKLGVLQNSTISATSHMSSHTVKLKKINLKSSL